MMQSRQAGQSIAEFIVTMAVLVPMLLVFASFANLLSLSTDTVEAGRFAAWERTVYQPTAGFDTNQISDKVRDNINNFYLDKRYADFGPGKELGNGLPSIVDQTVDGGRPASLRLPTGTNLGPGIASSNTRLHNQLADAVGGNGLGTSALQSPELSIAINENYSLFKLVGFKNYREVEYQDMATPDDLIAGRPQYNVSSHAALIAGGWMPRDDQELKDVTSAAAFDGKALSTFENPVGGLFVGTAGLNGVGFRQNGLARDNALTGVNGLSTAPDAGTSLLPYDLTPNP